MLTLLLDLDGTLLGNEIDQFVAVYTKALARHMSAYVEPELLIKTLLAATQHMIQMQRPEATLQASFEAAFYPALGVEKEKVQGAIEAFYREVFPTLRPYTQQRPAAVQLVEEAFRRGYQVGIATNPLFPLAAIEQRLEWAGLSPASYPFALIPSYETFHFAKPNPAFFAEFLARMGWPEGPVVMVGNEVDIDIRAAGGMGIKSFLVASTPVAMPHSSGAPAASGALDDFLPWLDATPEASLQPDYTLPSASLAVLRATPAVLPTLAQRLAREHWSRQPKAGEWSLTEILCHLRDVECEVNLPRFQKIAQEDNPFLPGMDTDPWAEARRYRQQDGQRAMLDFIAGRSALLTLLDNLAPEAWQKSVRHAIFGPTRLRELVSIAAQHDRIHIQQAHQLLRALSL